MIFRLARKPLIGIAVVSFAAAIVGAATQNRDAHLEGAACQEQAIAKLDEWAPERTWIAEFDPMPGVTAFKTPTSKIGMWIESQVYPDRHVELSKLHLTFDGKKGLLWQELVTWEKGSCEEKSAVNAPYGEIPPRHPFTDRDLQRFAQNNPEGAIVYTWSPAMPLSEESVRFIEEAVEELNARGHHLAVTFAADPDLSPELIEHGADSIRNLFHGKIDGPQQIYSLELRELGVGVHYPSMVVYSNGKLKNFIPGAMGKDRYVELLKGALRI